jgi:serine/threonine-protein kinase RsbW
MVGRSTTSLKQQTRHNWASVGRAVARRASERLETRVSEQVVTSNSATPGDAPHEASADEPVDLSETTTEDAVEIRLPADSAFLSVLRTATAGLAARLDFTLDEIEDLRIAVDEACAMLLPYAIETAQLRCRFVLTPDTLSVTVTLPTTRGQLPERDTFSWTVLSALAGEVDTGSNEDREVWIRLRKRRTPFGSG